MSGSLGCLITVRPLNMAEISIFFLKINTLWQKKQKQQQYLSRSVLQIDR